jgi:hypothetical protein
MSVVLTNPKAALTWVAIALLLAASDLTSAQFLAVGFPVLRVGDDRLRYPMRCCFGPALPNLPSPVPGVEAVFGVIFGALGKAHVWRFAGTSHRIAHSNME